MKKFIYFVLFNILFLPCFAIEVQNYTELKNAVNHKENTIELSQDISFGNPLTISTNTVLTSIENSTFTIIGNNANAPILTFTNADSSISNINFSSTTQNAYSSATVYIDISAIGAGQDYSTFIIDNVTFYNNLSSTTGALGGALHISSEQWTIISSTTFSSNSALGVGSKGGALYFSGQKGVQIIDSNFSSNTAQNGGAIYASTATIIGSTFSSNTVTNDGGAIYLSSGTIQDSTFSYNNAQNGGAIYASTATIIGSTFSSNTATNNGGAIYLLDGTTAISGTKLKNNKATQGGAIYNEAGSSLNILNSTLVNNSSTGDGGALYTEGVTNLVNSSFNNNTSGGNGGAIYVSNTTLTVSGTSDFIYNTSSAQGGAIYVDNGLLELNTNGETITFYGNTDSSGSNDIYLNNSSLNINSSFDNQGTVNFYGGVSTGTSSDNINSNNTNINWYASKGFDNSIVVNGGSLNILNATVPTFNNISLDSAKLSLQNNSIGNLNPTSLNITGDIPLYIDVDLVNHLADTVSNVNGTGKFVINTSEQVRILTDSPANDTYVISSGATLQVNENEDYVGPLYLYNLQNSTGGFKVIQTTRLNPTISALPVAVNSKVVANVNTVNSLYNRIDVMLSREYLDYYDAYRSQYSLNMQMIEQEVAKISGEDLEKRTEKLLWFIPNAGYQKVDYGNDVNNVKNIFYGGLIGVDFPFWISDDTSFIPTLFMGYLGAEQKYEDTTLNNNSFAIGGMLTWRKDFAILSAQTYITNGEEYYKYKVYDGSLDAFSTTASIKGEFNFDLADNIVIQPAFTAIYNYSNFQNYITANFANMYSTRFHNFLLTPSIKLMASYNKWYPYIGFSYHISDKQKGKVYANNFLLPEYKLKNFGELSIGLENTFFKDYSGYVQFSAYTGSSKGVSFQMGLRSYID